MAWMRRDSFWALQELMMPFGYLLFYCFNSIWGCHMSMIKLLFLPLLLWKNSFRYCCAKTPVDVKDWSKKRWYINSWLNYEWWQRRPSSLVTDLGCRINGLVTLHLERCARVTARLESTLHPCWNTIAVSRNSLESPLICARQGIDSLRKIKLVKLVGQRSNGFAWDKGTVGHTHGCGIITLDRREWLRLRPESVDLHLRNLCICLTIFD